MLWRLLGWICRWPAVIVVAIDAHGDVLLQKTVNLRLVIEGGLLVSVTAPREVILKNKTGRILSVEEVGVDFGKTGRRFVQPCAAALYINDCIAAKVRIAHALK